MKAKKRCLFDATNIEQREFSNMASETDEV
jgi:hypothetical protein